MKKLDLLMHCGASAVEREELSEFPTPEPTKTHYPIPNALLVNQIQGHIEAGGMEVVNESHGITHDGARYFGMLQVQPAASPMQKMFGPRWPGQPTGLQSVTDDFGLVIGIRNSHDKKFPAGLCMGSGVFVCDNLSFSGEIVVARKHTRFILRDLERLTAAAVSKLVAKRFDIAKRFERYQQTEITDNQAHDLVIRALDCKAVTATRIPSVLQQWRAPNHPEFSEKTVWRLFNAFTEASKGTSPTQVLRRGPALHGVMDQACGIVA